MNPFGLTKYGGKDWTALRIAGSRYYLLTIIDYFSRYVVAWGIVKTVTHREVRDLLTLTCLSEGIERQDQKPILRADQGSPNIAGSTRRLIQELEMILSPSRPYRPTDNSRQERWYRTVKEEKISCYPTYPSVECARLSLAHYIEFYNEKRPHQALLNYTPGQVHRLANKSKLLSHYKQMVQTVKEQRRKINWAGSNNKNYSGFKLTPLLA